MSNNEFASLNEVAEYLELPKPRALYKGQRDTAHLKKIHQGAPVCWLWRQVERHKAVIKAEGRCTGKCLDVFETEQAEASTQRRFPRSVAG